MGTYIVKIKDYYLEWSTIVDAPVTFGVKLDEFRAYYKEEYGESGMRGLDERLARTERQGTSSAEGLTFENLIVANRAGKDESELTADGIYRAYCLREPIGDSGTIRNV